MSFIEKLEKNLTDYFAEKHELNYFNIFFIIAKTELEYSDFTAKNYSAKANRIVKDLYNIYNINPSDITPKDIDRLLKYYEDEKKLTFGTLNQYSTSVKLIGFYFDNSFLKSYSYSSEAQAEFWTFDEVKKMILNEKDFKYKLAFTLGYFSFFKTSDMVNLRFSDVDLENSKIYLHSADKYITLDERSRLILQYAFDNSDHAIGNILENFGEGGCSSRILQNKANNIADEINVFKNGYEGFRKSHIYKCILSDNLLPLYHIGYTDGSVRNLKYKYTKNK